MPHQHISCFNLKMKRKNSKKGDEATLIKFRKLNDVEEEIRKGNPAADLVFAACVPALNRILDLIPIPDWPRLRELTPGLRNLVQRRLFHLKSLSGDFSVTSPLELDLRNQLSPRFPNAKRTAFYEFLAKFAPNLEELDADLYSLLKEGDFLRLRKIRLFCADWDSAIRSVQARMRTLEELKLSSNMSANWKQSSGLNFDLLYSLGHPTHLRHLDLREVVVRNSRIFPQDLPQIMPNLETVIFPLFAHAYFEEDFRELLSCANVAGLGLPCFCHAKSPVFEEDWDFEAALNLRMLAIECWPPSLDAGLWDDILQNVKKLEKLSLNALEMCPLLLRKVGSAHMPSLVEFEATAFDEDLKILNPHSDLVHILASAQFAQITRLELRISVSWHDQIVHIISSNIRKLEHLKLLVSDSNPEIEEVLFFMSIPVETLFLNYDNPEDDLLVIRLSSTASMKGSLRELSLSLNQNGEETELETQSLVSFLANCNRLEGVEISGVHDPHEVASEIALLNLPRLERLRIENDFENFEEDSASLSSSQSDLSQSEQI